MEDIRSSIELQEELQQFKRSKCERMWELRHAIEDPEAKVDILRSRLQQIPGRLCLTGWHRK